MLKVRKPGAGFGSRKGDFRLHQSAEVKEEELKTHRRESNDPSGTSTRWEKPYLVSSEWKKKKHDKPHKRQHVCSITSLEFPRLDHTGVAVSNLSHELSRKVRKNCNSQRGGDPSVQRVRTGDYKKGPCGERRHQIKRNVQKPGRVLTSPTWMNPAQKQVERTTPLPNSQSGSRSRPWPPSPPPSAVTLSTELQVTRWT